MNKIKVKSIISGNVYSVYEHKLNKEKHIPYIPKPIKLIPEELTLTCKSCGNQQTYSNKYSYRRAMGISQNPSDLTNRKQDNSGMCGTCSISAKRDWSNTNRKPHTKEHIEKLRLGSYNAQMNTNYTDVSQIPMKDNSYKRYRNRCRKISKSQLKHNNPTEYTRYQNNKYDGTDMNQLTIDHIKPLYKCYAEKINVREASDISNLQVITMRENILKDNPTAKFI